MAAAAQEIVSQVKIGKGNFGIAKLIKGQGEEMPSRMYFLHVTPSHTEVTDGRFLVRVKNKEQGPDSLETLLSPEDAVNIASSLKKKDFVTNLIPAPDSESVQVEFNTGEIRILPMGTEPYYSTTKTEIYKENPTFRIAFDPSIITAVLSNAFKGQDRIVMEFYGSDEAARITAGPNPDDPEVEAIVMPCAIKPRPV